MERSFQDLVEYAPDALIFIDQGGKIVLVSALAEALFGYPRAELIGQPIEILIPANVCETHARLVQAYAGDPVPRPMESRSGIPCMRRDGSEFTSEISLSPVGAGEGMLICAAIRDITARKRAEQEIEASLLIQSALNAILRVSLEPIPLEEQLQRILDHLFEIPWISLHAKGSIFLLDNGSKNLKMVVQRGLPEDLLAGCREVALGTCLCGSAATSEGIVFADAIDHRHELAYASTLPHGHYCVPIASKGRMYGVINLYVNEGHVRKSDEETFLSSVARVLAGMIERQESDKALKENEFQLLAAKRIQENLLPAQPPRIPGFDIAGASYPAEAAGGDSFDYIPMPDGSLCVTIGDVTGHGFASALLMASTQAYLRSLTPIYTDLSRIMTLANSALFRDTGEDRFVTLLLAHLNPLTRTFTYCSAGHPTGYVLHSRGEIKAALESTAMPLGLMTGHEFPAGMPVTLESGDLVILLTDGILEAQSSDEVFFGIERTLDVVRKSRTLSAAGIVECLYRAAMEFSRAEKPGDDLTAVIIKVA